MDDDLPPIASERELKVRLPDRLRVKLHSVKLLYGLNVRRIVADALCAYFAPGGAGHAEDALRRDDDVPRKP